MPTVAVIFGSRSAEHDVSIVTAIASVIKPLELMKRYTVVPIYIAKDGQWYSDEQLKDISLFTSGKIDAFLAKQKPISLQFGSGLTIVRAGVRTKTTKIDIVFPATHGTHGEDGELMAMLEMAHVPYVGCDVPSSVVAMDKVLAKIVATNEGISVPRYEWFYAHEFAADEKRILALLQRLSFPLFVKPAHLGSSIGISRVTNNTALKNAIEVAARYDEKILVEEAVNHLVEVTVPIIGNTQPRAALVEQPLTHAEDFFDFDSKYLHGGKKGKGGGSGGKVPQSQGYSKLPADIPTHLYKNAERTALDVYRALGCGGIARVDLLIDSHSETVYFNEVNPLPGSLYTHNWQAAGISAVELVGELLRFAQEKFDEKEHISTAFSTNYLQQF